MKPLDLVIVLAIDYCQADTGVVKPDCLMHMAQGLFGHQF